MFVLVSIVSSESCFSLIGRIIEERRCRLLPEIVEMLAYIKDWELGESRLQHAVDNQELEDSFKNLYLDEDADGAAGTTGSSGLGLVHLGLVHLGLLLISVKRGDSALLICYLHFVSVICDCDSVTWDL